MHSFFTSTNVRFGAGLIGSGIGYGTSNGIQESPFSSLAATGIGAYVGATFGKDIYDNFDFNRPLNRVANARIDISSITSETYNTQRDRTLSKVNHFITTNNNLRDRSETLPAAGSKRVIHRAAWNEERVYHNLKELTGLVRGVDYDEVSDIGKMIVNNEFDLKTMRSIQTSLYTDNNFNNTSFTNSTYTRALNPNKTIRGNVGKDALEKELVSVFESMNNPKDVAARKARDFATALSGRDISIHDNHLSISGGRTGDFKIPLTRWSVQDGAVIKTVQGDGFQYIAKSFNPYGDTYLTGNNVGDLDIHRGSKLSAIDAVKVDYDPEEWLTAISRAKGEALTNDDIKKGISQMGKLHQFEQQDAFKLPGESISARGRALSSSIELGDTIITNKDRYYIKQMATLSEGSSSKSEFATLLSYLERGAKDPIQRAQSMGDTTAITADRYKEKWFNPWPAAEYGEKIVNQRDVSLTTRTSSAGLERLGLGSILDEAHFGTRMHVSDAIADAFSEINPLYSIDDGQGITSSKNVEKLSIKQLVGVNLAGITNGTSTTITSTLDSKWLSDEFLSKPMAERRKLLGDLSMKFGPGDILGLGDGGVPEKLGAQFTSGILSDIQVTENGVRLLIEARNKPKGWVKVFGVTQKAGEIIAKDADHRKMVSLALLEGQGRISAKGGLITVKDKSLGKGKQSVSDFINSKGFSKFMESNSSIIDDVDFLHRWEDAKLDDVEKVLRGEAIDTKGLRGGSMDFLVDELDQTMGRSDPNSRALSANKLRQIMINQADSRTRQDMLLSLVDDAAQRSDDSFSKYAEIMKAYEEHDRQRIIAAQGMLSQLINQTYGDTINSRQFMSKTIYTGEQGVGIHGAGAKGSISTLEQSNFMANRSLVGATKGEMEGLLDQLGTRNASTIYELAMMERITSEGNFSAKEMDNIGRGMNVINEAFDMNPDRRAGYIQKKLGIQAEENLLQYSLHNKSNGISSMSIPLVDTNYSGIKEHGSQEPRSAQIDKLRKAVIIEDMKLASGDGHQKALDAATQEYLDYSERMLKGSSNIKKAGLKMSAHIATTGSAISIGGAMGQGLGDDGVAISFKDAQRAYSDAGLDIADFSKANKNGLIELTMPLSNGERGQMFSQWVREPAQGPMSTSTVKLFASKSLAEGHTYHYKKGEIFSTFASADYDADTFRLAHWFGKNETGLNSKQHALLSDIHNKSFTAARDIMDFQGALGVKKSTRSGKMIADIADRVGFLGAAKQKGMARKHSAAAVTRMNTIVNSMLADSTSDSETLFRSRNMLYAMTESLLKSSHKDTSEFMNNQQSAISTMEDMISRYNGKGSTSMTKEALKSGLSAQIDSLVGGKTSEMDTRLQDVYGKIKGTIVDTLERNAHNYNEQSLSPILSFDSSALKTAQGQVDVVQGTTHARSSGSDLSVPTIITGDGKEKKTIKCF